MKKSFKKSEYFLGAVLALIAGFPFAVEPPVSVTDTALAASLVAGTTIQEKALANYRFYRDNRRDFQVARDLCEELQANGKDITCPDVNDLSGIQIFLKTHENEKAVTVTGTGKVVLTKEDLTTFDVNQLRRFQRINTCPESLKDYLPGFYELCQSVVNIKRVRGRTVITGPNGAETQPAPTLDEIIKANKGVQRTW
ncbi:hypothetical protein K8942_04495 [Candidatus Peribacteria bacterium]|nr:MAG: hypothetical protein K8942_04495 [Candidatus Peribacteria bacterium]